MITLLKILSGMDIAERRLPQDGRIKRSIGGQDIDFRVSALPGYHGESIVLRILRPDSVRIGIQSLGFEQDDYVEEGNFNSRELSDLIYEYRLLRESNLLLFKGFTPEMLNKKGFANESKISVLAILYIIAGHELHHMKILVERYK